jgi:D-serine deaminase-like pyridoxal phosphate-dependent protein
MFYEAQIAGLQDTSAAVRWVTRLSARELRDRRGAVVEAVEAAVGALEIVNSGGTGSLEISSADPVVTEVTTGSGLYMPGIFDRYDAFQARPALFFALSVVRRPAPGMATLFGGGYIASGPAGVSRLPRLAHTGRGANLAIGDRVWLRGAKAGELLERFDTVHLVAGDELVASVPTYRGEGRNFG